MDTATLRDGTVLTLGDEVTTHFAGCRGYVFVVCELNPWQFCTSGYMVVVHLKDDPSRKILGFQKEGHDLGPLGIDGSWFKPVKKEQ